MLGGIGIIGRGGWKTHPLFRDYVSTLNGLDDDDKINQNKKCAHFLRYVLINDIPGDIDETSRWIGESTERVNSVNMDLVSLTRVVGASG